MTNEHNYRKEIGTRLKLYRETLKLSQKDFALKLEIKQESLSRYESGNQGIPDEIKLKLSNQNVNIDWLMTGKGNMFIDDNNDKFQTPAIRSDAQSSANEREKIKRINEEWIQRSNKYILSDSAERDEYIAKNLNLIKIINAPENNSLCQIINAIQIPEELKTFELIAIIHRGDDMEPIIRDSSIVLCDTFGYQGAGIYVVKINDIYTVKRISLKIDSYVISSDNKLYEPFETHIGNDKLKIGGKVRFVANIF